MQVYLFLDLDDTLFQTRPKCSSTASLRPTAYRKDGEALSFMTPAQVRWFDLLAAQATVIPVTARNQDAFRRVDLPFSSYVVLDFGGIVLLPDGTLDPVWDRKIRPSALDSGPYLAQVRDELTSLVVRENLEVSVRLISDYDLPLYVVLKHARGEVSVLDRIRHEALAALDRRRFFVHANDNNLSIVPRWLGKEHAVRYLLEQQLPPEPRLTIGMGDSLTDAGFLELCDHAILPRGSQLHQHTLGRLTRAAGEEQ